jgi:hypothetical protein
MTSPLCSHVVCFVSCEINDVVLCRVKYGCGVMRCESACLDAYSKLMVKKVSARLAKIRRFKNTRIRACFTTTFVD